MSYEQLVEVMAQLDQSAFRATQLMEWLWSHRATSFEQMTNLSPALRGKLAEQYSIRAMQLVEVNESAGGTRKFLARLEDGNLVESVIIPAAVGKAGERSERTTLCISSQVGCAFGCKFCASGLLGFTRNLNVAEIVGQILIAEEIAECRVDNIVFMGMGEPLSNMNNLIPALRLIMDHRTLNIGARHITVSTSGHVEGIRRLAGFKKPIRLAVSLHGVTNEIRSMIMPVNKKWPLEELISALKFWKETSKHKITLEYILIDGVNDDLVHARTLVRIARDLFAKVNLIPYNVVEGLEWKRPSETRCKTFTQEVLKGNIHVTMRYEKGEDINAACGQLRLRRKQDEATATTCTLEASTAASPCVTEASVSELPLENKASVSDSSGE